MEPFQAEVLANLLLAPGNHSTVLPENLLGQSAFPELRAPPSTTSAEDVAIASRLPSASSTSHALTRSRLPRWRTEDVRVMSTSLAMGGAGKSPRT
jgi:hypothetical protein